MMAITEKQKKSLIAAVVVLAAVLPPFINNDYILRVLTIAGVFTILTLSLNLVTGYTGQFCLGWAAFYGIGAYTSALLAMKLGFSFWLALPLGGVMAAAFGILLGIPTLRLKDIYLAITTLGFGEIIRLIMLNWTDLTRGSMGLPGIPSPRLFGYEFSSNLPYYYLILVLVLITVFTMHRLIDSRLGRALIAIREDDLAAKTAGIDITAYKVMAFAIGAFFAGIAGSFYAHYTSFIDPHTFSFMESISILAMVVLGGMGSITGSIIGALILSIIPEMLRGLSEYRMIMYGLIMMAVMILRPQGIMGKGREFARSAGKMRTRGGGRA
ncbi:MAG: branched-chain amino acid ABC transporter permease [Negativicutes bacterium]|nr:branched-chain amino acid ABC transporter permease [Negativicutes bacterium]